MKIPVKVFFLFNDMCQGKVGLAVWLHEKGDWFWQTEG